MGAQHDFGFSFSPNNFISPMSNEEFEAKTNNFLSFMEKADYTFDYRENEIFITFSFYSSYSFLNETMDKVEAYLKSILKKGTDVHGYYEEIKRTDESFTV